ncbi:MAG TPA: type II toxin-antitoxin system prevent-host-death family antitoxin [Gammaproteobacteria bacterium]
MDTMTYTAVREKLAETLDRVCDDHEPVFVIRRNGKTVVMLSLEDYRSMEATAYLLRSPRNAAELAESIAQIEAGKARHRWPGMKAAQSRKRRR